MNIFESMLNGDIELLLDACLGLATELLNKQKMGASLTDNEKKLIQAVSNVGRTLMFGELMGVLSDD